MGKKLTVYMIDGTEYGPRIAEIGNWVGKAMYSTRAGLSKFMKRPEFENPGIYCLKGAPNSDSFEERIYIGEAENVGTRIKQHVADPKKDFDELIFFISKDELLTKTQIRYIESRLIQMALEAKQAEIDNANSPNLPTLHEADISDMEYFLDQIKLILPVMGFNFLKSTTISFEEEKKEVNQERYQIKTSSFNAEMYEDEKGFVVTKGSQAKKELSNSITETYIKLRNKLVETEVLIDKKDYLEFASDTVFTSPSAAANIVLGRQSNGLVEWVTKNGKTYKEVNEL